MRLEYYMCQFLYSCYLIISLIEIKFIFQQTLKDPLSDFVYISGSAIITMLACRNMRNRHINSMLRYYAIRTNIFFWPSHLFTRIPRACYAYHPLIPYTDVGVIWGQRIYTLPNFRHFHRRIRRLCRHYPEPKVAYIRTFLNPKQNKRMHKAAYSNVCSNIHAVSSTLNMCGCRVGVHIRMFLLL